MASDPSALSGPLKSQLEGDPDMAELVGMFVGDLPQRIDAVARALDERRADDLKRITHQLRGSSASYGFPSIGSVAGRIEDSLHELGSSNGADLSSLKATVDELINLCKRATLA
ncbi:hypothetical protein PHYC_03991 [Phycisphaerales bacterium]|nr:hypothetical protein PHYC_03991 [Phycisphaerales bacterium]